MITRLIAVLVLTAVAVVAGPAFGQTLPSLKVLIPANPGGGWDQTARAMERALRAEKTVTGAIQLTNKGGAGGTIGLAEFSRSKGEGRHLMVMGLVMVGAILTNKSPVTLEAATPIARLTSEYLVIAVPASSKIQNLKDFTDALKKDPGATAIVGGSRGGVDHILAALVAETVGVPGAKVNYVAYAGGGEAVAALLGAQPAAGISGYGEFQAHIDSGKLRAIGLSAPTRIAGINVSTLKEQGVNVELGNWRGVVAPAGVSASDRKALLDGVEAMAKSASWKAELKKQNWEDAYLAGDAFGAFLILNLPLAPLWARLLMIPRAYLYSGILVFAFLGAYAANASVADLIIMFMIGLVGYVMRLYDFPAAPVLVGMILGPLAEQQLRRALALSQGDPLVFLTRPISAALVAITVAILVLPPLIGWLRRNRAPGPPRARCCP